MNLLEHDPWKLETSEEHTKPASSNIFSEPVTEFNELAGTLNTLKLNQSNGNEDSWNVTQHANILATSNEYQDENASKKTDKTNVLDTGDENNEWLEWITKIKKNYNPLSYDLVEIEEIPEREGVLFKHTNYLIKYMNPTSNASSSVIRRYSDFIWLQEILIKKYPFRMIPELPPKKMVAANSNNDVSFMVRRKKSLSRFLNLLTKHPFMKDDVYLNKFLSLEKDINSWKKQVEDEQIPDEFMDKQYSQSFKKIWKKEYAENWNTANNSIDTVIEVWNKIGVIFERQEKKIVQMAHERSILHSMINKLIDNTPNLYPIELDNTILDINNNLSMVNSNVKKTISVYDEECKEFANSIIPTFKKYIEILSSLKNLFERYKIMGGNNILQLYKHVESNMGRLENMKGKPDVSGAEYDRLKNTILYDKKLILEQTNRLWLIRECIMEEFLIFQKSQFLISSSFKSWIRVNSNFTGMEMNNWEVLMNQLIDLPSP
ncbi:hypothetical protein TPHA_0J00470 [Tetrapisispora phaffii CBS 4417]|uniref:Sorting nexin MVP1 n=1 Tax=Tetrapisispora phaffii (strain ATCC 24235 / CBS 4417 / NBRC 1672 / NRRL Y-8282 / UCD 70-5) TaxID=1071381 RepID=G8BYC8_TETPH|nr:hypothetical protein TPHA_0J00470 [Tetrapisispora phaffii CBS 4417]CCE64870.1 hypothetical protein TPHA_0J00470 [Tetrapisispora phaffii CBS 4417]